MIDDPICMYDCDIPVDGVAAFVFTSAERAKDLPHPPVYVSGYATGHPTARRLPAHWPLDDIMTAGFETARRLVGARPGSAPEDVDLPQVYDGFSPFVYFWLEVLGFCPVGEAHEFVAGRRHRQRRPGWPPGPLRWWRARERPHARDPADARVLPPALGPGRRPPARAAPRSAWPATPRRTSAARSPTAPTPPDLRLRGCVAVPLERFDSTATRLGDRAACLGERSRVDQRHVDGRRRGLAPDDGVFAAGKGFLLRRAGRQGSGMVSADSRLAHLLAGGWALSTSCR